MKRGRRKGSLDKEKMMMRYEYMLFHQNEIYPFTPTIRVLRDLWGLKTTSSVHSTLKNLEELGYVVSRKNGKTKKYFAVKKEKQSCISK